MALLSEPVKLLLFSKIMHILKSANCILSQIHFFSFDLYILCNKIIRLSSEMLEKSFCEYISCSKNQTCAFGNLYVHGVVSLSLSLSLSLYIYIYIYIYIYSLSLSLSIYIYIYI